MTVRSLALGDYQVLRKIHEKYYNEEFNFDELINSKLLQFFVITDDDNKIITAGGVRTLAETIIITDKSFPKKTRYKAFHDMLNVCAASANESGYDQLHAFIQDKNWSDILKKVGFKNTKGEPLVINL